MIYIYKNDIYFSFIHGVLGDLSVLLSLDAADPYLINIISLLLFYFTCFLSGDSSLSPILFTTSLEGDDSSSELVFVEIMYLNNSISLF